MINKLAGIAFIVFLAISLQSQSPVPQPSNINQATQSEGVNGTDVIVFAKKYLGTAYRQAGSNPATGFDCSGFVFFVFKYFGISLPRGSREYQSLGTALRPEEFKVGDVLVFYGYADKTHIGHVGIICEADGMNSRFIHSTSGKAYGVTISDLGSKMYTRRFYKCINVTGQQN